MRVDEILATEARVSVDEARAICREIGLNANIDFENLESDLSEAALTIIHRKVNDARAKLKCRRR